MKDNIKASLPHAAHLNPAIELCQPSENNSIWNNNNNNNDSLYLRTMYRLISGWTRVWKFISPSKGPQVITVLYICVEKRKHFMSLSMPWQKYSLFSISHRSAWARNCTEQVHCNHVARSRAGIKAVLFLCHPHFNCVSCSEEAETGYRHFHFIVIC